jgi:hypothetical protein
VILLTGSTKRRQQRDIDAAIAMWPIIGSADAGLGE